MALKKINLRKRTFTMMSCVSPILIQHHLNPSLYCTKQRRLCGTKCYSNNQYQYTINYNTKCDYIDDNPKPLKRRKIYHYLNQCNTKCIIISKPNHRNKTSSSKTRLKAPILHHCVINERWNMLMQDQNTEKTDNFMPNLPILSILNDSNWNQSQTLDIETQTDTTNSTQHTHYMDDSNTIYTPSPSKPIPTMYINDTYNTISPYSDTYSHLPSNNISDVWSQTIPSSELKKSINTPFKWDFHQYKDTNIYERTQSIDDDITETKLSDCMYGSLRFFMYLLIVCLMSWKYGMMTSFEGLFCSIMDDENHNRIFNVWMLLKWLLLILMIGLLCYVLRIIYKEFIAENEEEKRFKFVFDADEFMKDYKRRNVYSLNRYNLF